MNKFAIILPTIGRETLRPAIESVLVQTYQNYLLIVSHDTESSYDIGNGLIGDNFRIMHVFAGNNAPSNDSGAAARNYAIQFVPPDCNWICYLDDDDIWHNTRLASFNSFIEMHIDEYEDYPYFQLFYSYADLYKLKHKSPRSSEKRLKKIGVVNNVTAGGMCHKMEVFQKTKGWNPLNTEDHDRELYDEMKKHCVHDVLEQSTFDFIWR